MILLLICCRKGCVFMPNYEELYYIAKKNYFQAVEERDSLRRTVSDLQQICNNLCRELTQKQDYLKTVQQKKDSVQSALDKCQSIISQEFETMQKNLISAGDEYMKFISADSQVANLSDIYSEDLRLTKTALENTKDTLQKQIRKLLSDETEASQAVSDSESRLANIKNQIRNCDTNAANNRVNYYYSEMKTYERKWQEQLYEEY